jgi:hypothetical protein
METEMQRRTNLDPEHKQAGWTYGQSGACYDRTTRVNYPWHEPWSPLPIVGPQKCIRCGKIEPKSD